MDDRADDDYAVAVLASIAFNNILKVEYFLFLRTHVRGIPAYPAGVSCATG